MNGKTNPSKVEEVKIGGTAVNALRINWKQNETAMGYIIEKKEGNSWKRLARIEGKNVTTYRAENLKSNTTYEFRMQHLDLKIIRRFMENGITYRVLPMQTMLFRAV